VRSCVIAVAVAAPLAGCAFPDAMPGARASCEPIHEPETFPHRAGPPWPEARRDGTQVPAWNVGGTVYVACGAGGKACR
jgi:hypothetical protein